MAFGKMPHAGGMCSMELFARDVLPKGCEERRIENPLLRIAVEDTPCRDS
jgi:hypothetical protein